MLQFAIDGITAFSEIPLRFASYLGFIVSSFAFLVRGRRARAQDLGHTTSPATPRRFSTVLFLGGVQLIGIGILGEYVGRIYDEIKARPLYLIAENAGVGLRDTDAIPAGMPLAR